MRERRMTAYFFREVGYSTQRCSSNTPRARQLKKTSDWVVIYYDGRSGERQCTVITSSYGPLEGKRIIRGRKPECMDYYLHPLPTDVHPPEVQNGFSI